MNHAELMAMEWSEVLAWHVEALRLSGGKAVK
jgi:hypothetical protein